jgi:hypothetical protein
MARAPRNRPHFHVEGGGQAELYTSPRLVITGLPPARVRAAHAQRLERAVGTAVAAARQRLAARDEAVAEGEKGFYLEFEIPAAERAAVGRAMTIGTVRWFDADKGYGFIKPDDGGVDVMVDICALERAVLYAGGVDDHAQRQGDPKRTSSGRRRRHLVFFLEITLPP